MDVRGIEMQIGGGWQFVQQGEAPGAGGCAMEQQAAPVLAPESGHRVTFRLFRRQAGKFLRVAAARRGAEPSDRTDRALRMVPHANEGAELHHCLVVRAGVAG